MSQDTKDLRRALVANIVSFGLVGASGVMMVLVIARTYGPATVGVFDQVYSIYILLSQIVTAGLHQSVLKYAAQHDAEPESLDAMMTAALVTVVGFAGTLTAALFLVRGWITGWLGSPGVNTAAGYVFPGLFFFALNKVLLGYLNGRQRMLAFAAFQSLRSIFLLVSLAAVVFVSKDGLLAPAIFSVTESLLFVVLAAYVARSLTPRWTASSTDWVREHLSFGVRAAGAPMIAELNTRVNVLVLGAFAADQQVGVLSLAVMIFDGYNQLAIVGRNIYNPMLTQAHHRSADELAPLMENAKRRAYRVMVPFAAVIVLAFPLMVSVLGLDASFQGCATPLAILMCGAAVSAGYVPIGQVLTQTGHPGAQSWLSLWVCGSNAALNFALVPWLGILGSAVATACSLLLQIVYFRRLVRSRLGFDP